MGRRKQPSPSSHHGEAAPAGIPGGKTMVASSRRRRGCHCRGPRVRWRRLFCVTAGIPKKKFRWWNSGTPTAINCGVKVVADGRWQLMQGAVIVKPNVQPLGRNLEDRQALVTARVSPLNRRFQLSRVMFGRMCYQLSKCRLPLTEHGPRRPCPAMRSVKERH